MGSDLTYRCLGGNRYEITLSFYRDCAGVPADDSASIDLSSSCFGPLNVYLNRIPGTGQEISPICPNDTTTCNGGTYTGIQEYVYRGIVTLPGPCVDWTFSYNLCCRNAAITNIDVPDATQMYIYATLNNTSGICNNSPTFSNKPVPFACLGQQFCYNHGAYDIDGDSLVYSLITPYDSPGLPVTYLSPFSATNPLSSSPAVTFNPMTGDICMTPTALEVTVMAVLVKEYRNRVLIGSVERDIQLTVTTCNNQLPSLTGINGTTNFSTTICAGKQTCFTIFSSDADTNQNTFIDWDNSIPNGTFSQIPGHRESATFCWTPTQADINPNPYCFTVTVHDDNCPYYGIQTFSYCIMVTGIKADAGPDQIVGCNATQTLVASATGGSGSYTYQWNTGVSDSALTSGPGTYIVTASDGMCSNSDTALIVPDIATPLAAFAMNYSCTGLSVQFTDQSSVTVGTITGLTWLFGDSTTSTASNPIHLYASSGVYSVILIVETGNGCIDSVIRILNLNSNQPTAGFTFNTACLGFPINFTDISNSSGTIASWLWDFGDGTTSTVPNPVHTYSSAGNFNVSLILTNVSGCTDSIMHVVIVHPLPDANAGGDQVVCRGGSVTLTASGGVSYSWFPGGSNTSSITIQPAVTRILVVTVTDANGCVDKDSATILVNRPPNVNAGTNRLICVGDSTTLNAGVQGLGSSFTYLWSPGSGTTQQIRVSPDSITTYIVIVTDNHGCRDTDNVVVGLRPPTLIDAGNDRSICRGESVILTATGGAIYSWNPGGVHGSIIVSPSATQTYIVTATDAASCHAKDSVIVIVNPNPVADAGPDQSVCAGNSLTLTAAGGGTYEWNPGGSTSQQLIVTPVSDTTYHVIVTNNFGCRDTDQVAITVNAISVADAGPDTSICSGDHVTLSGTGGGSYSWQPGGDTTSSISISPSATTIYTLIVSSGTSCRDTDRVTVLVNPVPVAVAGPDQSICIGNSATLTASGGGSYEWNPGGLASQQLIVSPVSSSGYDVIVTNNFGCKDTDSVFVTVNAFLVADAGPDTSICSGDHITLTGAGGGNYFWQPGGDTTSSISISPPVTTTYTLFVAIGSTCQDTDYVTVVVNPIPVSAFTNPVSICENSSVQFTDQSSVTSGSIVTWNWDFGNNTTSATQNPSLAYTDSGLHTISLFIISDAGCRDTSISSIQIVPLLSPSFTFNDVCFHDSVYFNNTSSVATGETFGYQWNFGDNLTSATMNPTHVYLTTGQFNVTLAFTSISGCLDSVTGTVTVFSLPVANAGTDQSICFGEAATLTASGGELYTWNFGNANTSFVIVTPASTQTYFVLVTDTNGCRAIDSVTVAVNPNPIADAGSDQSICIGSSATLSASGGVSYLWDPGSVPTQQMSVHPVVATTYTVTVTNGFGCHSTDQVMVSLNELPVPNAGYDRVICYGDSITLNGNGGGNYVWQPGGSISSSVAVAPGITSDYILYITNSSGCSASDTVTVFVNPLPVCNFTNPATVCEHDSIRFTDHSSVSSGTISYLNWNFGNGITSVLQNPIILLGSPGNYFVTLTATTDQGCVDTAKTVVGVAPLPDISFNANDACLGVPISFINNTTLSGGGTLFYQWSFGDSTSSTTGSPLHTYSGYGHYQVLLIATTSYGCVDTAIVPIKVHPDPVAAFSNSSVCENSSALFADSSFIPSDIIQSWSWNFGDNSGSIGQQSTHMYISHGLFQVQLTVVSNFGCADSVTHPQRIFPLPVPAFSGENKCLGDSIQFHNLTTISSGSVREWSWNFGDNFFSNLFSPAHLYHHPGSYNVGLSVVSDSGCITSVILPSAVVFQLPEAAFTPNVTEVEEVFAFVNFINQSSIDSASFWSFGDGAFSSEFSPGHLYHETGAFEIQLIVVDQNGCRDTAYSEINVKPATSLFIPNAFSPNGDRVNDTFHAYFVNKVSVTTQIFDRWGKKIYEWSDLNGSWDGTVDGSQAQSDVYVYRLESIDIFGVKEVRIGYVTLVR